MSIESKTSGTIPAAVVIPPSQCSHLELATQPQLHRFTVEQYHRMIDGGILDEDDKVELLDGWILQMSPIGPSHVVCVYEIARRLGSVLPQGWHVRPQGPLTFAASEPEPDVAIVRGIIRDWSKQHPGGSDVALIVEVAESSLTRDRDIKRQLYAAAGIPEYWIVNLSDRQVEVHREPQTMATGSEYRLREVAAVSEHVSLLIEGREVARIKVADMLP